MVMQFCKESELRKVKLNGRTIDIPKDWEVVRLKDVVKEFISGGTPSTKNPEYWDGDIPWITSAYISGYYITSGEKYITRKGLENSSTNIVPKDNIIIATRVGLGKAAINLIDVAINQDLTGLIINKSAIDPEFLVRYLTSDLIVSRIISSARGTTIKGITRKFLESLPIIKPPLEEQRKIAEILSTVDKAIEKTDEMIAKTERLKKGFMQKLLTGVVRVGVEDGKISFYREERFKEREIGKIPEDWKVVRLGNVMELKNGERPKVVKNGKIPIYGANGVMDYTDEFLVDNDFTIVIGRVGASGEVHLAKGRIWVSDNAIYSNNYKKSIIHMPFYYYFLKFFNLKQFATKTTHPIITQSFLKSLKLPLPPLKEQKSIANILSNLDRNLEILRKEKEKLERIKKGLMDVLLTGKVRVKV